LQPLQPPGLPLPVGGQHRHALDLRAHQLDGRAAASHPVRAQVQLLARAAGLYQRGRVLKGEPSLLAFSGAAGGYCRHPLVSRRASTNAEEGTSTCSGAFFSRSSLSCSPPSRRRRRARRTPSATATPTAPRPTRATSRDRCASPTHSRPRRACASPWSASAAAPSTR